MMSQGYLEEQGNPTTCFMERRRAQHYEGHDSRYATCALQSHDSTYYSNCLVGGVMSSTIRWVLTPLDSVKCNMQVHPQKFPNFTGGLQMVFRQGGFRGLYRGFIPTVLSYSSQTGTKYMMYEWGKDHLNEWAGEENARAYKSLIYITAAGCAEAVADVLMCPWETLKVQMQTANQRSPQLMPAMTSLFQRPYQILESLPPLWSRQILGTMANFLTFEHTANFLYRDILEGDKMDFSTSTQLTVTFCAGFVSGLVATVISHPADSLISLKAKHPDASIQQLIQQVGWKNLATKGLGPRIALTGSIIGFQWFVYDTFKSTMGMGTSGG